MPRLTRRESRRLCVLLQLSVFLSACMSWQTQPVSPTQLINDQRPSVVRVTRPDSSRIVLREPVVQGDTLIGFPQSATADSLIRTRVPLADVQDIAILRSDPNKNTLLAAGFVIAVFSTLCFLGDAFGCGPDSATDILLVGDR